MSCYRFPKQFYSILKDIFEMQREKKSFKMLIEMHECNGNAMYTISAIFLFRATNNFLRFFPLHMCDASERECTEHSPWTRKQCIENGSLWRAFNGLLFPYISHYTLTDSIYDTHIVKTKEVWNMHAFGGCKALKCFWTGIFCFPFLFCISVNKIPSISPAYMHTHSHILYRIN